MNYDLQTRAHTSSTLEQLLGAIVTAQLVRRAPDLEETYIFKHALVQEGAYTSLTRHERRRLHLQVAETLERQNAGELDQHAALLAYHYERAEEWSAALDYLRRAAEWARRGAAYREQAALLGRAIEIAEHAGQVERLPELHAQRGSALMHVTAWRDAREHLTRALDLLPADVTPARTQVLIDLAVVSQWLWDMATAQRYAQAALTMAEQLGDAELAASATTSLAAAQVSDGRAEEGIQTFEIAFQRAPRLDTTTLVRAMELSGIVLYWVGAYDRALERNQEAIRRAYPLSDYVTQTRGLQNLGVTLAAQGDYGRALETLDRAREIAREQGLLPWLARTLAMIGGVHLDLFDYVGAEALSMRAREVAHQASFATAAVGAGIDLIMNYARRGEVASADRFVQIVQFGIPAVFGSHRWIWETRFAFARAELALERGQRELARAQAEDAIARSRSTGRRKYEILGLLVRAQAEGATDLAGANADARRALDLARELDEPALILRAALAVCDLGNPSAQRDARTAQQRIAASLPAGDVRDRFLAVTSEWI